MKLKRLFADRKGTLFMWVVFVMALIALVFFAFVFQTGIEAVQNALNPHLSEENWISEEHYTAFYYAATFVTNIWTYIIAIGVFILGYWIYHYAQRKGAGY